MLAKASASGEYSDAALSLASRSRILHLNLDSPRAVLLTKEAASD